MIRVCIVTAALEGEKEEEEEEDKIACKGERERGRIVMFGVRGTMAECQS